MTLLCNYVVFPLGFCMILFILWKTDTDAIYFLFDDDGQVVCEWVCVRMCASARRCVSGEWISEQEMCVDRVIENERKLLSLVYFSLSLLLSILRDGGLNPNVSYNQSIDCSFSTPETTCRLLHNQTFKKLTSNPAWVNKVLKSVWLTALGLAFQVLLSWFSIWSCSGCFEFALSWVGLFWCFQAAFTPNPPSLLYTKELSSVHAAALHFNRNLPGFSFRCLTVRLNISNILNELTTYYRMMVPEQSPG